MNTNLLSRFALSDSDASAALAVGLAATQTRFVPPAHVKRWTGRAVPTILLPSLAALRIAVYQLLFLDRIPAHAERVVEAIAMAAQTGRN